MKLGVKQSKLLATAAKQPNMLRFVSELCLSSTIIGLICSTHLIYTVLCQDNHPQISATPVTVDHVQQQQQQQQIQNLSPNVSSNNPNSDHYTRKPEQLVEENTKAYGLAESDDSITGNSLTEANSNQAQTMDSLPEASRIWLQSIRGSEDNSTPMPDNSLSFKTSSTPVSIKSRRQAENYIAAGDWWTKLGTKQPTTSKTSFQLPPETKSSATGPNRNPGSEVISKSKKREKVPIERGEQGKATKRPPPPAAKRIVYREQPLNQNAIITLRYQLKAIRNQHKTLVTRSMRQLQQLDEKLVESYKLCFKKKMPLYAGMLYRTRDFVVKISKDVNHEKRVLEAMSKQVQKVLRQKMTNQTLVREYNRLVAGATKTEQQSISSTATDFEMKRKEPEVKSFGFERELVTTTTTKKPQPAQRYIVSVNEVNLKKELNKIQALIDRVNGSCYELSSVVDDINFLFKLTSDYSNKKGSFISSKMSKLSKFYGSPEVAAIEGASGNSLTPEQQRKARRALKSPIRAFIERYGKLTMAPQEPTLNASLLPSNGTDPMTTADPTEIKPLFEPSNLTYTDPVDNDLGFDEARGVDGE